MQAWVRTRCGPANSSLRLAKNVPTPSDPTRTATSDVLIHVSHVALQFNSELFLKVFPSFPLISSRFWIPELELSGEVIGAGSRAPPEVRDIGTHVVAFQTIPAFALGRGVLAEYVRVPGTQVSPLQPSVDLVQASGIVGAGCTALKLLRESGVQSGQRILLNGASGSVGSVLVQLCKLRGVYVVGIASGGNEALVRALGADEFIDYRAHPDSLSSFLTTTYGNSPFDFVMDCVGSQDLYARSPGYLKADGALLNIGGMQGSAVKIMRNILSNILLPTWLGGVPRRYMFFSSPPLRDDAVYLCQLLGEGKLKVPVDSVFEMEDALASYERISTKRARGKVVIKVKKD